MRALILLVCVVTAFAAHEPRGDVHGHINSLVALIQEGEMEPPTDIANYSAEQFAGLMNNIIIRASKMREVMNNLGISDTGKQGLPVLV